jgi:hypothetical protein
MEDKFTNKINDYLKKYWMPELLNNELLDSLRHRADNGQPADVNTPDNNSKISG